MLAELPSDRQEFISELAEDVWRAYSNERQTFLDGVANSVNVSLSYGDYEDAFDGLIEHRRTKFHIYCNTTRSQPINSARARFTVAHELGHYFIDEHRNALLAGKASHFSFTEHPAENPVEVEANLFAANLLMPISEYRKSLLELAAGLNGIIDAASTFGVSIQSSALRFTAISRRPCAIVMFRENAKPWWDISRELKMLGYDKIQKIVRDGIPLDSATGLALGDTNAYLGPVHCNTTRASSWFRNVSRGSKMDEVFMESAIRLRSRGVLTLLEPCTIRR